MAELRRRKLRVDKPFAVMMANLAEVERHCYVNAEEKKNLESYQRPIVLLNVRPESSIAKETAPGQLTLGVMLPYTPLHYLLFHDFNIQSLSYFPRALVMTSGNLSEEPIATGNDEARERLASLADVFLMHNRDIHIRCDDSVLRVLDISAVKKSAVTGAPHHLFTNAYFLRRSRGYAPDPIPLPLKVPSILANRPRA